MFSGDTVDLLQPAISNISSQGHSTSLFNRNTSDSSPILNSKDSQQQQTASNLFSVNDSPDDFAASVSPLNNALFESNQVQPSQDSSGAPSNVPALTKDTSMANPVTVSAAVTGMTSNLVANPDEFNYTVQNFQQINSNAPELLHPDFLDSTKYHRNGGVTYTDQNMHMSVKEASPTVPQPPIDPVGTANPTTTTNEATEIFNPAAAEHFHLQNQSSANIISQLGNMTISDNNTNSSSYPQYQISKSVADFAQYQIAQSNPGQFQEQPYFANQDKCATPVVQNNYQHQKNQPQFNNQQYTPSAQSASGLFIPEMYNTVKNSPETPKFFVPEKPAAAAAALSPLMFPDYNNQNYQLNENHNKTVPSQTYDFSQNQVSQHKQNQQFVNGIDSQTNGIDWLKSPGSWTEGAQKLKDGLKTAMDKVLTTLDPGMEEYLSK